MGLTALCPGTFDPVTNGHLDIIGRASRDLRRGHRRRAREPRETAAVLARRACRDARGGLRGLAERARWPGSRACWSISPQAGRGRRDREGPAGDLRLRVRDPDGPDEPPPRRGGDAVHAHQPDVVVPVVLAGEGGRPLRRRRRGPRARPGQEAARSTGWRSADVDITARLNQLDELVRDAKAMPLSSSVLVNRDEVLDLLAEMQEALPDEIKQARWIVKDREELLAKAAADGEKIVGAAREEQLRMARQEEIVARANEEAERMLADAEEQARAMRREAEEYVDAKLAQFEIALRRILEDSQAPAERSRRPSTRSRSAATSSGRPARRPSRSSAAGDERWSHERRSRPSCSTRSGREPRDRSTSVISWASRERSTERAPARHRWTDLGTELARVREDDPVDGDLLLESLVEGILVSGALAARWRCSCARCLTDFEQPFAVELHEMFVAGARRGRRRLPARPRGLDRPRADGAGRGRRGAAVLAAVHGPTARACARSAAATGTWASARATTRAPTRGGPGSTAAPADGPELTDSDRHEKETTDGGSEEEAEQVPRRQARGELEGERAVLRRVPAVQAAQAPAPGVRQLRVLRGPAGGRGRVARRGRRPRRGVAGGPRPGARRGVRRRRAPRGGADASLLRVRAGPHRHQRAAGVPRRLGARASS